MFAGILAMGGLGPTEIGVIVVLALLLFGARRLPETGRALGEGIKEFKKGLKGGFGDDEKDGPPDPGRKTIEGRAALPSDDRTEKR